MTYDTDDDMDKLADLLAKPDEPDEPLAKPDDAMEETEENEAGMCCFIY